MTYTISPLPAGNSITPLCPTVVPCFPFLYGASTRNQSLRIPRNPTASATGETSVPESAVHETSYDHVCGARSLYAGSLYSCIFLHPHLLSANSSRTAIKNHTPQTATPESAASARPAKKTTLSSHPPILIHIAPRYWSYPRFATALRLHGSASSVQGMLQLTTTHTDSGARCGWINCLGMRL